MVGMISLLNFAIRAKTFANVLLFVRKNSVSKTQILVIMTLIMFQWALFACMCTSTYMFVHL